MPHNYWQCDSKRNTGESYFAAWLRHECLATALLDNDSNCAVFRADVLSMTTVDFMTKEDAIEYCERNGTVMLYPSWATLKLSLNIVIYIKVMGYCVHVCEVNIVLNFTGLCLFGNCSLIVKLDWFVNIFVKLPKLCVVWWWTLLKAWFRPFPVRFGSVRIGTVVILTRPVQWTANAFTVRFATEVNRACEQVHFAVQYGGTCLYAKVWAEK